MHRSGRRQTAHGPAQVSGPTYTLSRAGKIVRLGGAAAVAVLTLAGTLYGQDSDFPFGPFRMYATRDNPNGVVRIVAVQTVDADGRIQNVTNASGAPRRAEIEGRMPEFRADCGRFAPLLPLYRPGPTVRTVRLVEQNYHLMNGRRQARSDDVVCSLPWTRR